MFSDPYKVSEYNRWTSPYLDHDAEAVRNDNDLKVEIAELKAKYVILFVCRFFSLFLLEIVKIFSLMSCMEVDSNNTYDELVCNTASRYYLF